LGLVERTSLEACTVLRELAAVADLAARLGVERRLGEHDDPGFTRRERRHRCAFLVQCGHAPFGGERLIAAEARLLARIVELRAHLELARRARPLALGIHRAIETGFVD